MNEAIALIAEERDDLVDKVILYHLRRQALDNAKLEWRHGDTGDNRYLSELEQYICELFSVKYEGSLYSRAFEPYYSGEADAVYVFNVMAKVRKEQRIGGGN